MVRNAKFQEDGIDQDTEICHIEERLGAGSSLGLDVILTHDAILRCDRVWGTRVPSSSLIVPLLRSFPGQLVYGSLENRVDPSPPRHET